MKNNKITVHWAIALIVLVAAYVTGYLSQGDGEEDEEWKRKEAQLLQQNEELSRMATSLDSSYKELISAKERGEYAYRDSLRRALNIRERYIHGLHEAEALTDDSVTRYLKHLVVLQPADTLASPRPR